MKTTVVCLFVVLFSHLTFAEDGISNPNLSQLRNSETTKNCPNSKVCHNGYLTLVAQFYIALAISRATWNGEKLVNPNRGALMIQYSMDGLADWLYDLTLGISDEFNQHAESFRALGCAPFVHPNSVQGSVRNILDRESRHRCQ